TCGTWLPSSPTRHKTHCRGPAGPSHSQFPDKEPVLAAVPQQGLRRTAAQAFHAELTPSLAGAALGKHPSASLTQKEKVSRGFPLLLSLHSSHISLLPENSHTLWVSSTLCLINRINYFNYKILISAERRDLDHEEWEVVSEHLVEGEDGKDGSMEDSDSREWEQGDCCDGDAKAKRVAAVPPMFQNIHVAFRVHYITHSAAQLIGVTGDHECLGQWHSYVPLKCDKDGFWSESISLPADTRVEWKFILVENGKVRRWEECSNRTLVTEHEDQIVHQWWGYH
uniref:Starch-binding domain-containing protein 1 n=1 Tax=Ficedula albicollis TaxID=59894 RepID=U3KJK7_FICAL